MPKREHQDLDHAAPVRVEVVPRRGLSRQEAARYVGICTTKFDELIGTALITIETVATLPDDANGRAIADFTGPAVLRAIEHAEVEFAAEPEACA